MMHLHRSGTQGSAAVLCCARTSVTPASPHRPRLAVTTSHARRGLRAAALARPQQCEMAVGGQLWLAYLCMYVRMVTKADWN